MARMIPFGKIKNVGTAILKAPGSVAGAAIKLTKSTVKPGGGRSTPEPVSPTAAPVNVTEQLGLDPAPVEKPKPARKPRRKPVTTIDAAADPSEVRATPADVSAVLGNADSAKSTGK